jgi:hypothetical protein
MSPEGARLYATTNPDSPYHWLMTEYLNNKDLRDRRILWSDHYTMVECPGSFVPVKMRKTGTELAGSSI